jgi:hypothetical protein
MNCLSCISNDYFFRKDTFNCILRNETPITDVVEIKPSILLYFLFVGILGISILISIIFLCTSRHPEDNQGNAYKEKSNVKINKSGIEPGKISKENHDINTKIKGPINESEMSLLNNVNSINNEGTI